MGEESVRPKDSIHLRFPTSPSRSHPRYQRLSNSLPERSTVHFQGLHEHFPWVHHKEGATLLRVNYAAALCTPRLERVQRDGCSLGHMDRAWTRGLRFPCKTELEVGKRRQTGHPLKQGVWLSPHTAICQQRFLKCLRILQSRLNLTRWENRIYFI